MVMAVIRVVINGCDRRYGQGVHIVQVKAVIVVRMSEELASTQGPK
jgi:hypothetical protein